MWGYPHTPAVHHDSGSLYRRVSISSGGGGGRRHTNTRKKSKVEKIFWRKNKVAVLFFKTGLSAFAFSKYKTSTLSKFTKAWQYLNIVLLVTDEAVF